MYFIRLEKYYRIFDMELFQYIQENNNYFLRLMVFLILQIT